MFRNNVLHGPWGRDEVEGASLVVRQTTRGGEGVKNGRHNLPIMVINVAFPLTVRFRYKTFLKFHIQPNSANKFQFIAKLLLGRFLLRFPVRLVN